jgi:hypothetical protein
MIGLIIGGLMTIVSLVFAIISLANGRSNKAVVWGIGFIIALILVIISVYQMVHKVSDKVKDGIDWVKEQENVRTSEEDLARKDERQEWLDSLQLHNIEKYENKIPADYYINNPPVKDANGKTIIPFLYPFQFLYNNVAQTGDIVINGEDSVFVNNVSQIAFDENFAIIKVDNSQSQEMQKAGHPEIEYLLFDLRTRNFETAPNLEKLLNLADRIGYVGPLQMQYLSDVCRGWVEYPTYD